MSSREGGGLRREGPVRHNARACPPAGGRCRGRRAVREARPQPGSPDGSRSSPRYRSEGTRPSAYRQCPCRCSRRVRCSRKRSAPGYPRFSPPRPPRPVSGRKSACACVVPTRAKNHTRPVAVACPGVARFRGQMLRVAQNGDRGRGARPAPASDSLVSNWAERKEESQLDPGIAVADPVRLHHRLPLSLRPLQHRPGGGASSSRNAAIAAPERTPTGPPATSGSRSSRPPSRWEWLPG